MRRLVLTLLILAVLIGGVAAQDAPPAAYVPIVRRAPELTALPTDPPTDTPVLPTDPPVLPTGTPTS